MTETTMNSPNEATTSNKKTTFGNREIFSSVPVRRGSKYIDIVLQRLQRDLLADKSSAIIGVIGVAGTADAMTTAVNLAIRAADHRFTPSLVIDGNYYGQKISRHYRASGPGLSDCLSGATKLQNCLRPTKIPNMNVLGLGQTGLARQIVIGTDEVHDFFVHVRENFKLSVLELPSFDEPSFANAMLPHLDGVLIVARYGSLKDQFVKLSDAIEDGGSKVAGIVMTGQESKLPHWLGRHF